MRILFNIADELNESRIDVSYEENLELLVGQIILNRISGIAYGQIESSALNSEIVKSLKFLKEKNMTLNNEFMHNLRYLSQMLYNTDFEYALLKGAYLTPFLYKAGHRTSNDIDILVSSENVSKIQKLLLSQGFVQGYIRDGLIIPASRKEIIESKMNNGETVPFLKQMDGNILEVDINFSLDFKPSHDKQIVSEMLSSAVYVEKDDIRFKTLRFDDFLIHLCCHLYKEATTYNWLLNRRDLMLYKFSDINVFVHKHGSNNYFRSLIYRIKHFGFEKECYYTLENSSIIYPALNNLEGFVDVKEAVRPSDLNFMTLIIWPSRKKLFQYHMSFTDWFFCSNRISQLEEIPYETD
jgi:hypothetical protein